MNARQMVIMGSSDGHELYENPAMNGVMTCTETGYSYLGCNFTPKQRPVLPSFSPSDGGQGCVSLLDPAALTHQGSAESVPSDKICHSRCIDSCPDGMPSSRHRDSPPLQI
jgi:hypothetical protein